MHTIRLSSHWSVSIADSGSTKTDLPFTPSNDFEGSIVLERSFGRPTGLVDSQEVFLVIETSTNLEVLPEVQLKIQLNGKQLESPVLCSESGNHLIRSSVGTQLHARNRLRLILCVPAVALTLQAVRLEIVDS